jgi:hypothetical protein
MKTARARLLRVSPLLSSWLVWRRSSASSSQSRVKSRAFQPPQLAQRRGEAVLPRVGGELPQDQRGGHGARMDRGGDTQDLRPMGANQSAVDAPGDQRFERRIGRRLAEAVEPPAFQIRDARRELKPEQGTEGEDMVGSPAIGVVAAGCDLALMVEQPVEHMRGFAGGRRDHLGVDGAYRSERCV